MTRKLTAEEKAQARLAVKLADMIRPMLAGHPEVIQGAVIADLTAEWIMGHEPNFRKVCTLTHFQAILGMLEDMRLRGIDPWRDPKPGESRH